jgi:hypothetical protein
MKLGPVWYMFDEYDLVSEARHLQYCIITLTLLWCHSCAALVAAGGFCGATQEKVATLEVYDGVWPILINYMVIFGWVQSALGSPLSHKNMDLHVDCDDGGKTGWFPVAKEDQNEPNALYIGYKLTLDEMAVGDMPKRQ